MSDLNINKKRLNKLKNIALSDHDVMNLVKGRARVVLYSDLWKYKTLDELLAPYGAIFLLYEWKPGSGHWIAVFKQDKNTAEVYDPYSAFIDDELSWVPSKFKDISNQNYPYLTALFLNSKYKNLIYNQYKFQKHGDGIKTCGRWSALRIMFRDLDLDSFAKLFLGKNADDLVTMLTSPDLKY
jgi:hypothetical protein